MPNKRKPGTFADMAGLASPVTPVSWRSQSVKRFLANASATEAMGLSEALAQGDWVRAPWSEMVLGLSPREWRERKEVPPLTSVTDKKSNYGHLRNETISPSEDRRSAIDLAIIPSFMAMETCYELCVGKHSRSWLRPLRSWLPDVKKRENVKEDRESSHHQSCGSLWTKCRYL